MYDLHGGFIVFQTPTVATQPDLTALYVIADGYSHSDFMQPNLVGLQPILEDLGLDSMEPFQGLYTARYLAVLRLVPTPHTYRRVQTGTYSAALADSGISY